MKKILPCIVFLLLHVLGCTTDDEVESQPQMVVEGWVDAGEFPVVILTSTLPVSEHRSDLSNLKEHILRWATVTVDDGERSVVLTGKVDEKYFPPYIYTTSEMRGRAGRTYRLTVEYKNFHAEAETYVPQPVALDSVRVLPCDDDTLYQIKAWFRDNPAEKNYFKFFTCVGTTSRMWLSSYMQTLDDAMFSAGEEVCHTVFKGRIVTHRERYVPYFTSRDTLLVKFAQMDSVSFAFWNQMEHNMTLGNSPLTASRRNPSFNVRGALGYWCGYGSSVWPVTISDSIRHAKK